MNKKLLSLCLTLSLISTSIIAQGIDIKQQKVTEQRKAETNLTESYTIKLDSTIVKNSSRVNSNKSEYAYDNKGNLIQFIKTTWNANKWVFYNKYEYIYDSNRNLTSNIEYKWSTTDQMWIGVYKFERVFDINNLVLNTTYKWNKTANKWLEESKSEYTYDSNGNVTIDKSYNWITAENKWYAGVQIEFKYDNKGQDTLSVWSKWNKTTNSWVVESKTEYKYDNSGNLLLLACFNVGETDKSWIESSKSEYKYDNLNNKIEYLFSLWDKPSNVWINSLKYEYIYDNNILIRQNTYDWVTSVNSWIANSKFDFTYDNNDNRTFETVQKWDVMTYTWIGSYKNEYTYQNDLFVSKLYSSSTFFPDFINKNLPIDKKQYIWNTDSKQWETDYNVTEENYYSEVSATNVIIPSESKIRIYPNPVTDILKIDNVQGALNVKVYNLQGKLLLKTNKNGVDFSEYEIGIYILDVNGQKIKILRK